MRRSDITPREILKITKKFLKQIKYKPKPSRGRKYKHDTALILSMMIVQQLYNFSYREVLKYFEKELKVKVPVLSNYYYRVKNIDKEILKKIYTIFGKKNSIKLQF